MMSLAGLHLYGYMRISTTEIKSDTEGLRQSKKSGKYLTMTDILKESDLIISTCSQLLT